MLKVKKYVSFKELLGLELMVLMAELRQELMDKVYGEYGDLEGRLERCVETVLVDFKES